MHREKSNAQLRRKWDKCANVDLREPTLLRKLCDLYEADFVCFGLPLPSACT